MDADSDPDRNVVALVRRYYAALDEHAYDEVADVLAPDFVQRRPDRTFEGRASFVRFMREERPNPNTSHELLEIVADDGDGGGDEAGAVAVRGQVCDGARCSDSAGGSGPILFEFADFFEVEDGRIARLDTYSR